MARNVYDQASRYTVKIRPPQYLRWIFARYAVAIGFQGWLDTRTLPFPGDPERSCDTVACLTDPTGGEAWAMPIEFCLEPDASMFGRMLVYLGQLWEEIRPGPERGRHYQVGAVVVNLTGNGRTPRTMAFGTTSVRTLLGVEEVNLASINAAATLAEIAGGGTDRCLLPWIPLMQGGGTSAIIQQWRELASGEPDARLRADYGGLALVFAEAARCHEVWREGLEDWNMVESQQVLEWKAEGQAEGQAEMLVQLLEARFQVLPAEVPSRIRSTKNREQLLHWGRVAVTVGSLDEFRRLTSL